MQSSEKKGQFGFTPGIDFVAFEEYTQGKGSVTDMLSFSDVVRDQTERALWEVKNVIDCVPDELWNKIYCDCPMWKHIYHMLHSLDRWFINPFSENFKEPDFHEPELNNIDFHSDKVLTREVLDEYFADVRGKTEAYLKLLNDDMLSDYPEGSEYDRFTLIMAQHRHLHTHMGMIMGFIIDDTGKWPAVLGLTKAIPSGPYDKYC